MTDPWIPLVGLITLVGLSVVTYQYRWGDSDEEEQAEGNDRIERE